MDFHDFDYIFQSGILSGCRNENQTKNHGIPKIFVKKLFPTPKNIYKHVRILSVCTGSSENNIPNNFWKFSKNDHYIVNSRIFLIFG